LQFGRRKEGSEQRAIGKPGFDPGNGSRIAAAISDLPAIMVDRSRTPSLRCFCRVKLGTTMELLDTRHSGSCTLGDSKSVEKFYTTVRLREGVRNQVSVLMYI
jgi:hypothetical protein